MEIIAHRGASHDAPENTLAAVRLAWSQGADAVEVDVHLTADHQLAVIHDPDTMRTAGVPGLIAAATFDELQALDVGRWKSPAFAGEPIPSLDAVLATVPVSRRVYIELKTGGLAVAELVRSLARSRLSPTQVAIISFDLAVVHAAKRMLPRTQVSWLVEPRSWDEPFPVVAIVQEARSAGLDGLSLDATLIDEGVLDCVRGAHLKLHAWTVDDADQAQWMATWKVDGITTNRPGWLRHELNF